MPTLGHVKHTRGLDETELVLTVSVLLCLLWGLAEAEPMLTVSVSPSPLGHVKHTRGPF